MGSGPGHVDGFGRLVEAQAQHFVWCVSWIYDGRRWRATVSRGGSGGGYVVWVVPGRCTCANLAGTKTRSQGMGMAECLAPMMYCETAGFDQLFKTPTSLLERELCNLLPAPTICEVERGF